MVLILKSTRKNKKYMVFSNKLGTFVHFGDSRYGQFRDITGLGLYSHLDHNDPARRKRFLQRHHGVSSKKKALINISQDSALYYSTKYLW